MSLADNATLCLSAVITQLAALGVGEQTYKDVVLHTLLDAVLKGLRSKTEVSHSLRLNSHVNSEVSFAVNVRYFFSFLSERTARLHLGAGLPRQDLPLQKRVPGSRPADGLQRPRVRLLRAHETHPGESVTQHGLTVPGSGFFKANITAYSDTTFLSNPTRYHEIDL